jgi:hypothetical protein
MQSIPGVAQIAENVFVRKVNTIEGMKWEVVDDPYTPEPIAAYEELRDAHEDALFFAKL